MIISLHIRLCCQTLIISSNEWIIDQIYYVDLTHNHLWLKYKAHYIAKQNQSKLLTVVLIIIRCEAGEADTILDVNIIRTLW